MKIQDFVFLLVFVGVFLRRQPRAVVIAGLACLALSLPLFSLWMFFTAERLTWYAAAFFLSAILFSLRK